MDILRRAFSRLASLWRNLRHYRAVDDDLDRELRAAFELYVDEQVRSGMGQAEARRRATIELGRSDAIKTQVRDARSGAGLEILWHDVTFGARLLRRQPLFTATAVLSLSLGIGATTTIFTLVNAVLLRDLRVPDPRSLVEVGRTTQFGRGTAFSYPAYQRLRDETTVFTGLLALSKNTVSGNADGGASAAAGRFVSGNFFEVLGIAPAAGRLFSADDDHVDDAARAAVAVISYRFWQRAFGGTNVLGRTIRVEPVPFTIVGVASPAFDDVVVGRSADFFVPLASEALVRRDSNLRDAATNWIGVIGRRKPGVSAAAAQAGLEPAFARFMADLARDVRDPDARRRLLAQRVFTQSASNGVSDIRRDAAAPLLLLMAAVVVVLLIACANVVNLLLARGVTRRREIAVRVALGAGRARVIRQLLTEASLLGAAGAAVGVVLAMFGAPLVLTLMSPGAAVLDLDVSPDRTTLLFTASIALAASLVAGIVPALRTSQIDIAPSFQADARTLRVTRESTRWSRVLIAAQVALSIILVAGASLLMATLRNMRGVDRGFDAEHVVLFNLDPTRVGYTGGRLAQYRGEVLDRLRSVPGVSAASLSKVTPISGGGIDLPVTIEGRPRERDVMVLVNRITEGFFATLATPLLRGRDFARTDALPGGGAIVNAAFARKYFAEEDAIGRRVALGDGPLQEIVGVVANAKYLTLRDGDLPTVYVYLAGNDEAGFTLSVRAADEPLAVISAIRERLQSVAASVPVSAPRTMSSQIERSLTSERLIAQLLSAFAVLALVLASIGLYGMLGYAVARRTAEIGLRLALGASRADVLRAILLPSLIVVASGLAVGLPLTTLLAKPLAGLLYGVAPTDPWILAGAAASLLVVGAAAATVPAVRAARVDPLIALRHE